MLYAYPPAILASIAFLFVVICSVSMEAWDTCDCTTMTFTILLTAAALHCVLVTNDDDDDDDYRPLRNLLKQDDFPFLDCHVPDETLVLLLHVSSLFLGSSIVTLVVFDLVSFAQVLSWFRRAVWAHSHPPLRLVVPLALPFITFFQPTTLFETRKALPLLSPRRPVRHSKRPFRERERVDLRYSPHP